MGYYNHPLHAVATSSLCPLRLWGQIDKHPCEAKQTSMPRSRIDFDTIYNGLLPTMWISSVLGLKGPHSFKTSLQG